MASGLDEHLARLIAHPERLPIDDRSLWAAIADGGEPAYRAVLHAWNRVRGAATTSPDEPNATRTTRRYAALAVLAADAFDDVRVWEALLEETDTDERARAVGRLAEVLQPGGPSRRFARGVVVHHVSSRLESGLLSNDDVTAMEQLRVDDHGAFYLPARRAVAESLDDDSAIGGAAEALSDALLIAAATATPNAPDVLRTVLSYWGEAEPLDDIPTAEVGEDDAPASWTATCRLIGGVNARSAASSLIELALPTDFWRLDGGPGDEFVRALEQTVADDAEDRLREIATAGVPASSLAVEAMTRRRARLADAPPITRSRVHAVESALVEAGVLATPVGDQGRDAVLTSARSGDTALDLAARLLGAAGRAVSFGVRAAGGEVVTLHALQALDAVALLAGGAAAPAEFGESRDERVLGRRLDDGRELELGGRRLDAAAFHALIPTQGPDYPIAVYRIRVGEVVTYAAIDEDAWSRFLDWAATSELPPTDPIPARRAARSIGLLGRLFGRE